MRRAAGIGGHNGAGPGLKDRVNHILLERLGHPLMIDHIGPRGAAAPGIGGEIHHLQLWNALQHLASTLLLMEHIFE